MLEIGDHDPPGYVYVS